MGVARPLTFIQLIVESVKLVVDILLRSQKQKVYSEPDQVKQRGTMTQQTGKFCTVFNCMDGRCQAVAHDYCRNVLGFDFPDTVTIAGCNGVLAGDNQAEHDRSLYKARISVEKHGAKVAVVLGHQHCAGHPVDDDQHHADLKTAAETILGWGLYDEVIALFVQIPAATYVEVHRVSRQQVAA